MYVYSPEFLDAEGAYRREQLTRAWPSRRTRRARHRRAARPERSSSAARPTTSSPPEPAALPARAPPVTAGPQAERTPVPAAHV